MDHLICASLSHTHYLYEVGMLKVPFVYIMYVSSSHTARVRVNRVRLISNPTRSQLNREHVFSMPPFTPENLVTRDGFGSPVPRQPAHLHT